MLNVYYKDIENVDYFTQTSRCASYSIADNGEGSNGGVAIEEPINEGIIIYVATAKQKLHKAITRKAVIIKLSCTHSGQKGKQRSM